MILYPSLGRAESVNVKQIGILAVAVVLAGASFFMMRQQSGNNAPQQVVAEAPKPEVKMVKILVTNRDYAVGDRIAPSSLIWQDIPANANITSFVTQEANPKAAEMYLDAVVKMPIFAGEPFILSKIVAVDDKTGVMASLVAPGMRATAVNISADTAVSGFIVPDSRVDVILTRQIQFPSGGQTITRTVSSTIFSNVKVLAIDQSTSITKEQKAISGTTATLELNVEDAEKLRSADSLGDISLVLRSYADASGPSGSNPNALAMSQPSLTPSKATQAILNPQPITPPAPKVVKIYRGGQ